MTSSAAAVKGVGVGERRTAKGGTDLREAERVVLYGLLSEPLEAWPLCREVLTADDFGPEHQRIARVVFGHLVQGKPVELAAIVDELPPREKHAALELARAYGTTGNLAFYVDSLVRRRDCRRNPSEDGFQGLAIGAALAAEEERLEHGVARIATGFARLDTALGGGFTVPSLNVLGAGPKSGKSTQAQIIATRHVEAGGLVYFLDLENGRRRFLRQLLCRRAQLGQKEVAAALRDHRAGVFVSRSQVERWQAAKVWVRSLGRGLFVEHTPPKDLAGRIVDARRHAGDRPLLVVIDSLQKLPGGLEDRRATIDTWVRLFERLRHELDAVFLVISEIKRSTKGTYTAHEAAFKESGGIEYAADLAMTLTRAAADEDQQAGATLRIELAREADEDPRGDVATYVPVFPHYDLDERDPVDRPRARTRGPAQRERAGAREFLEKLLAAGPVAAAEILNQAEAASLSRATVYRAKSELGVRSNFGCWRLP